MMSAYMRNWLPQKKYDKSNFRSILNQKSWGKKFFAHNLIFLCILQPIGCNSRNSRLSSETRNKVDQHQNFQFGHLLFFKNLEN